MKLIDTVDMMISTDYRERFAAEYLQTKIRYQKLKKFNTKIEAAEIDRVNRGPLAKCEDPKHDCPRELLRDQQRVMGEYLHLLELRAELEEIDLDLRELSDEITQKEQRELIEKQSSVINARDLLIEKQGKELFECYKVIADLTPASAGSIAEDSKAAEKENTADIGPAERENTAEDKPTCEVNPDPRENHVMTRAEDFFKKFPEAPRDIDGMPVPCVEGLGYSGSCPSGGNDCVECWSRAVNQTEACDG